MAEAAEVDVREIGDVDALFVRQLPPLPYRLTALAIAAIQISPFGVPIHSHSIVPGGFDV